MLRRCVTVIAPRTLVSARPTVTLCQSSLTPSHFPARLIAAPSSLPCRSMSAVPYTKPPMLPPSPHDRSQPLQVFPALLPATEHAPATFPFGRIALPAAGVFFATALSYVSVNQSPLMAGHVLVMPRSNQARVKELSEEHLADLWMTAQHVARVFEDRFKAEAITFGESRASTAACPFFSLFVSVAHSSIISCLLVCLLSHSRRRGSRPKDSLCAHSFDSAPSEGSAAQG